MKDVTAGIIEINGKYLIALRSEGRPLAGMWEFPGGTREEGETLEECLWRELREELRIDAIIGDKLGEYEHGEGDRKIKFHFYRVTRFSGELELTVHDKIKLVSSEEMDDYLLCPVDVLFVKKLRAYDVLY